jgi:hypothetical protein
MLNKIIAHIKELYFTDPDLTHLEPVTPNPIIIPDYSLGTNVSTTFKDLQGTALYNTLLNEAPYSRPEHIKGIYEASDENAIYPLPAELDAPFEMVETAFASRISHTVWVLWDKDGNINIINPRPNHGRFLCGPDMIVVHEKADPIPDNVQFACKINIGVNLDGNTLRGIRWTFFQKEEK